MCHMALDALMHVSVAGAREPSFVMPSHCSTRNALRPLSAVVCLCMLPSCTPIVPKSMTFPACSSGSTRLLKPPLRTTGQVFQASPLAVQACCAFQGRRHWAGIWGTAPRARAQVYREQMRDLLSPANQKLQVKELSLGTDSNATWRARVLRLSVGLQQ